MVYFFIREKVTKAENQNFREEKNEHQDLLPATAENALTLFNKDEMHERAMVRSLLEFGLKEWDEEHKVADHIFKEIELNQLEELIDNKELVKVVQTYKDWYQEGIEPTPKNFLYHDNLQMSSLVVSIMDFNYEISPKWKEIGRAHV